MGDNSILTSVCVYYIVDVLGNIVDEENLGNCHGRIYT